MSQNRCFVGAEMDTFPLCWRAALDVSRARIGKDLIIEAVYQNLVVGKNGPGSFHRSSTRLDLRRRIHVSLWESLRMSRLQGRGAARRCRNTVSGCEKH